MFVFFTQGTASVERSKHSLLSFIMGRALFSQKYLSEPAVCEDPAPPFGVPCRRWSPCNQFDPDSEDFFKNAQLEQFLDGLFDNSVWTLQRRNPQNSAALDNVNDSASSTTTSAGDDDESLSDPIDDDKSLSDSDEDDSDDSDESLSNSNHHDESLSDSDDDDSDDSDESLSDSNDSPMAIGTDDPASLLDVYVPADFAQDEPRRQSHSTRSTRHPSSLRHPEDSLISHQTSPASNFIISAPHSASSTSTVVSTTQTHPDPQQAAGSPQSPVVSRTVNITPINISPSLPTPASPSPPTTSTTYPDNTTNLIAPF